MAYLNDDIFFYLFTTIAANRDSDWHIRDRQDAIRCASQVCQHWRDMILPAYGIWRRLIWVNKGKGLDWMKLVLERAKRSPVLSVTVELQDWLSWVETSNTIPSFAIDVLNHNWEKFEEVDITICARTFAFLNTSNYNRILDQLKRPAPNLRIFALRDLEAWHSRPLTLELFNNSAPLLRDLTYTPFRIHRSASWLTQLTNLDFTPHSMRNVLNVISWAPRLRWMGLIGCMGQQRPLLDECATVASTSPTILARLARITDLSISLDVFNALWSSRILSPAEAQSHITVPVIQPVTDQNQHSQFLISLSNFFYHHSGITSSNIHERNLQWSVEAAWASITFVAKAHSDNTLKPTDIQLRFEFDVDDSLTGRRFLVRAMTEYARSAASLHLFFVGGLEDYVNLEILDSLLLSMEGVETITLDGTSLRYYNAVEKSRGPLFPNLKVVHYNARSTRYKDTLCHLQDFLMRRVGAGRPVVQTIHFSNPKDDANRIYSALKGVPGLRILYRKRRDVEDV
ncbi:hypothetical protein CPC08DRAFT_823459 [Agrocybe pediades]|nr:hypothetical protein CPC08DRAFT_823459 [Agrocybe pediades]